MLLRTAYPSCLKVVSLNKRDETSDAIHTDVEACHIHKMQKQEPVNAPGQAAGHGEVG